MTERNDDKPPPTETVRIIGAEEARVARGENEQPPLIDLTAAERETPSDEPVEAIVPGERSASWSASAMGEAPSAVASASSGEGDSTPGDTGGASSGEQPTGEVPPLQHWTEPPTGAVPAIFADDEGGGAADDDFDAWAPVTGSEPRFRAEGSDWADADFSDELSGEHKLGALSEEGPRDEEAEFAEALAQRRRGGRHRNPKDEAAATRAPAAAAAATEVPAPPARHAPRARPRPEELHPPGPAASRDLPTAIMTAATVAIVALVCFYSGTTWTAVLASVVVGLASLEFCNALRTKGLHCATLLAFAASLTLPLAAKHYGTQAYPVYFALIVIFSMLWFLWEVTPGRPLVSVATTVLAFAYVGALGGFAGLLLANPNGIGLLLGVVICTIAYDVVGFFVGSQFGRTPIAPRISPHKSVQGTVAGMAASVILGVLVAGQIHPWTMGYGFWLGVLVAIGAFFGDLSESMIKRDLGLKDFGSLLPGHGGVLDRFDGLLFCLPIAYYLAVYLKIG